MSFSIPKEQLKGINYKQITKTKHKDNIKAAKETKTEETSFAKEEFISTGQAEQIINPKSADFNSEILSKLESFAQDNPLWMSFMEGLTAGILAGKAAKNAELSKEVAAYMSDLKSNVEKAYKKTNKMNKLKNFLLKNDVGLTTLCFSGILFMVGGMVNMACWDESAKFFAVSHAKLHLAADAGLAVGSLATAIGSHVASDKLVPSMNVAGNKFVPAGYHEKDPAFLTILPGTNKLLYCGIKKDAVNGEIYPHLIWEKDLPDKAASITLGKSLHIPATSDKDMDKKTYGTVIRYENPNLKTKIKDVTHPEEFTTDDKEEHDRQVQSDWDVFANRFTNVQIKTNN